MKDKAKGIIKNPQSWGL